MSSSMDFHIHTTASDGSDSPAVLAEKLLAAGITAFSVTDHDTIAGALEMESLVPEGVRYVRGVELSCVSPAGKCHILGYGYDPEHPAFLRALEEGRTLRREKLERRLERLRQVHGIELTAEEARWLHSRKSPGKPHLGRILLNRGLAPTLDAAIQTYLKDVPVRDRIEAQTAVTAIEDAGGLSVWAHPLGGENERRLTEGEVAAQLDMLMGYGLRGMECWYSRYTLAQVRFLREQAAAHGLVITGGSDYHGANKRDLELGRLNLEDVPAEGIAWLWDSPTP